MIKHGGRQDGEKIDKDMEGERKREEWGVVEAGRKEGRMEGTQNSRMTTVDGPLLASSSWST